mmetsp:Transcript_11685/g.22100  ORF Transcript_11685/g.22100 Transcript_11685/m.22100 type:complete len:227 (-) Transcript_11685:316-996(-)
MRYFEKSGSWKRAADECWQPAEEAVRRRHRRSAPCATGIVRARCECTSHRPAWHRIRPPPPPRLLRYCSPDGNHPSDSRSRTCPTPTGEVGAGTASPPRTPSVLVRTPRLHETLFGTEEERIAYALLVANGRQMMTSVGRVIRWVVVGKLRGHGNTPSHISLSRIHTGACVIIPAAHPEADQSDPVQYPNGTFVFPLQTQCSCGEVGIVGTPPGPTVGSGDASFCE